MLSVLLKPAIYWPVTLMVDVAIQAAFLAFDITPHWLPTIAITAYFIAIVMFFGVMIATGAANPFL